MNVKIIATKSCSHSLNLQQELREMGIPYKVLFVEDEPDAVMTHAIRYSPSLLVNNEVVFRGQPTPHALREYFGKLSH